MLPNLPAGEEVDALVDMSEGDASRNLVAASGAVAVEEVGDFAEGFDVGEAGDAELVFGVSFAAGEVAIKVQEGEGGVKLDAGAEEEAAARDEDIEATAFEGEHCRGRWLEDSVGAWKRGRVKVLKLR